MNDSEPEIRNPAWGQDDADAPSDDASADAAPSPPGLEDLSPAAADRIRRFMAESTIRGGSSPAEVANLYTSQEVMADDDATTYLDRRFVHGEVPADWRNFQDELSSAHFDGPPTGSADALLARVRRRDQSRSSGRSIFDDPDEDELLDDGHFGRLDERDPNLGDLDEDARRAIERYILSDVLCYGVAPYRVMQLREMLRTSGDERALQYLDLPFELGDRPADWDDLRDRALRLRARFEARGMDPATTYTNAENAYPELEARELLSLLEDRAERR